MECYTISKRDLFISEVRRMTSDVMCIPYFPHRNIESAYFDLMEDMSYNEVEKDPLFLYDYYIYLALIELGYYNEL